MAAVTTSLQSHLADRYRIERELGRGGMGTVFLAEDLKHHRRVAIKVLEPELAASLGRERFLREVETVAHLGHPHILPLHDSGDAGGILYYVMPYVEDESLQARLAREKQLPLDDALRIAREVADALSYAHAHGVVHRDIKPGNILLQGGHAVVADFGLARAITPAEVDPAAPTGAGPLTAAGSALGTPAYMSPEQAAGRRDLDGRSDQYALGCVLYEMLAGQPPFTGPTVESLVHQHLSVTPRPVTDLRPRVPGTVRDALARALAKTPADRYATTAEFAAALAAEGPAARASTRRQPVRAVLAAVVAVAVVIAAFAVWQVRSRRAVPSHPAKPEWILLAEFEGPADDAAVAGTVRALMNAELERSGGLRPVAADQVQAALALAEMPDSTRVTEAVARELALRNNIGSVVSGQVLRAGSAYSVVVRVVNAERGELVASLHEQARNADELIPAVGRLTRGLLESLGGKATALRRQSDVYVGQTRSFEAFQLYHRSIEVGLAGSFHETIPLLRQAVRLDPEFGVAWGWLGVMYDNAAMLDSAVSAYERALKLSYRIAEPGRSNFEALYWYDLGELERGVRIFDRAIEQYPDVADLYNNRGWGLIVIGHLERALADGRTAESLYPIRPPALARGNIATLLSVLGRTDEAWAVTDSIGGTLGEVNAMSALMTAGQWARAESVAVAVERQPTPAPGSRCHSSGVLAVLPALRGELRASERAMAEYASVSNQAGFRDKFNSAWRLQAMLRAVAPGLGRTPIFAAPGDSSISTLVSLAMSEVTTGSADDAARLLGVIRRRPERELRRLDSGAAPALLEAWLDRDAGRWPRVVETMRPLCQWKGHVGMYCDGPGQVFSRWLVAEAFERQGQADSARVYYQAVLSPAPLMWEEQLQRALLLPFAHQRLTMLHARAGRVPDAERHLAALEALWSRPDDVARSLLDEAREAVRAARGAARTQRARS